ncbi:beta-propeller domain-containing protein, partial [Candidatus Azambacteria bacterium]|nr:beta-propeller domain-containing protein [Candidatus Azambacteria bacterium]
IGVTAITAFPLASLGIASNSIPEQGEMLLVKDKQILVIMTDQQIVAYDISNPAKPVKKWTNDLKNNTRITTARLKDNLIYIVTSTYPDLKSPCPVIPMIRGDVVISIPCNKIWAPRSVQPANTIYTVLAIDPVTGMEKNTLTFLGDTNNTTISMFGDNLYLAYQLPSAQETVTLDFFKTDLKDLLSSSLRTRIGEILSYNISSQSKLTEITNEVEKENQLGSESDQLKIETEIKNRMTDYLTRRVRDINQTTIIRVSLNSLTIGASTKIPGYLLNQFSMDEYNGNLRVAVTVGEQGNRDGNKNDIYVLDSKLAIIGSVIDLGLTERIYSARFIGDRGYLVTFRQIDPFYILDLSIPSSPKMVGELKIPGYSAYLEPLADNLVLGVGREDRKVKMSLFDVTDPKNPVEKSKYLLDESWTEVESNHHAFLRDPKHKVFFIPSGKGGYVVSYDSDKLGLAATVAVNQVKRALFIEDNLYIVAENKITVLDEVTWKETKDFRF